MAESHPVKGLYTSDIVIMRTKDGKSAYVMASSNLTMKLIRMFKFTFCGTFASSSSRGQILYQSGLKKRVLVG